MLASISHIKAQRRDDSQTAKRSIPGLDGLRGIAVLLVIVAHLQLFHQIRGVLQSHGLRLLSELFAIDPGDLGVSMFFVISGYLITTLLLKQMTLSGLSLGNFYLRRCFRIFPPYYVYLACIGLLSYCNVTRMPGGTWLSALTYTSNYYPYRWSHPESSGWLVGHTWSLSLEEQFYLFWPACLSLLRKRKAAVVGIVLFAVAPLSRLVTFHVLPATGFDDQVYRMFHTRIDTIMAGCILALASTWPSWQCRLEYARSWRWSFVVALALLILNLMGSVQSQVFKMTFGLSFECVLLTFIMFYCIGTVPAGLDRLINGRFLRHIGVISYSLYLWQQLFTGPVNLFGRHRAILPIVMSSFICAELSYRLVEKTSHVLRDKVLLAKFASA